MSDWNDLQSQNSKLKNIVEQKEEKILLLMDKYVVLILTVSMFHVIKLDLSISTRKKYSARLSFSFETEVFEYLPQNRARSLFIERFQKHGSCLFFCLVTDLCELRLSYLLQNIILVSVNYVETYYRQPGVSCSR